MKVYFSNPDLLFAGEYPVPRLGQGAFAAALKALVREVCALLMSLHYTLRRDDALSTKTFPSQYTA